MRYILALAITLGLALPAVAAEFYVVQDKSTKKCKVVSAKPTDQTWIVVGNAAFKSQSEADQQLTILCKQ
jgi:hypothetical protein